jgi:hypothetical protein
MGLLVMRLCMCRVVERVTCAPKAISRFANSKAGFMWPCTGYGMSRIWWWCDMVFGCGGGGVWWRYIQICFVCLYIYDFCLCGMQEKLYEVFLVIKHYFLF